MKVAVVFVMLFLAVAVKIVTDLHARRLRLRLLALGRELRQVSTRLKTSERKRTRLEREKKTLDLRVDRAQKDKEGLLEVVEELKIE